jgi:endonuclease/exonuclease/phosphatase family metal-dependent hydrolase
MTNRNNVGLRIASHNMCRGGRVEAGNAWQRLMSDVEADIVCAQETRHPSLYLSSDGGWREPIHRAVTHGQWGSAILSRRHASTELPIADEFSGWVVGAHVHDVDMGGRVQDLEVYSVHIPSPGPYERRVRKLIDILGRTPSRHPRILAGDFNVTVALRQPSEDWKNSPGEKRILQRFRDELDLTNAWQAMHPEEPLPQTLRWSGNKTVPYHCDGIFVDSRCRAHLREAKVLDGDSWPSLSDHNPVFAMLR